MRENKFQKSLIDDLKIRLDGCVITKNDTKYIQGFPDLTILYKDKWAALECKVKADSKKRPNQEHYVDELNSMGYARFVCPENKEEVITDLLEYFER